ncbi:MAG: hypothetical protein AAF828_08300 [Bacteroidota bacterium]
MKTRIFFYTMQCYISASWGCALRGKHLSRQERKNVIYLGAITPIGDDLADQEGLSSQEMLAAIKKRYEDLPELLSVAKYLYEKLSSYDNPAFQGVFKKTMQSQDASSIQLHAPKMSKDQLLAVTQLKGGMSTILYRVVLQNPLREGEEKCLVQLGFVLQQINDMFDLYKDHQEGQQTLFTKSSNLADNYHVFQRSLTELKQLFFALPYPPKNIKRSWREMSTILARGLLCMEQLLAQQARFSLPFSIDNYERKDLICDMELPSNLWKSIQYSRALSKV